MQILNRDDPRTLAMAKPARCRRNFWSELPPQTRRLGPDRTSGKPVARTRSTGFDAACRPAAGRLAQRGQCAGSTGLVPGRGPAAPRPCWARCATFKGLPHRVEKVAEINGITFYDDSKGTNVGATVAALIGMPRKVVLIAGGDGKGQDFSPLAPAVAQHARAVVLIGRDGARIGAVLEHCGVPLLRAGSMEEAVQTELTARRRRETPYCSRRPAPATTCSAITASRRSLRQCRTATGREGKD